MDVPRPRRRVNAARIAAPFAIVVLAAAGIAAGSTLFRPQPAEPFVERGEVVTDTAVRGELVRAVRAPGTLVAQRVQLASAPADGNVSAVPVRVGSTVQPDDVIAQLSDPQIDAAVADARAQLTAAVAEERSVEAQARASALDAAAAADAALANYRQVRQQAQRFTDLHRQGLVSDYDASVAEIKAGAARDAADFDRRKIVVDAADSRAKVAVAQAHIQQLRAALEARTAERAALAVRAGAAGVVTSISVERGARIAAGTQIARIVGQRDLKATLAVPETDIRDVVAGLRATVDTGNGAAHGYVARVDPAAQNGAIAVDITLEDPLPSNARPDLHVDGTIEIARLRHVVSIARPANAADDSSVALYRLTLDGRHAERVRVDLGRGSLERVAVRSGLAPGNTVITSDTSAYTAAVIRIK